MGKLSSELWKGAWSSATAYTIGDYVSLSGSTYVCIANNTNQTPPNATYWVLVAQAGANGIDGEVVGPVSSTNNGIVLFDGTDGQTIKDSGITIIDEDNMASDSATDVPTQQSVKAYVDALPTSEILQVIFASTSVEVSSTSASYADTGLTASITPASASNKVLVFVQHGESYISADANYLAWKLVRGVTDLITPAGYLGAAASGAMNLPGGGCVYLDSPATTSPTTYKTQFARSTGSGSVTVQKNSSTSTIILMEVKG